MAFQANPELWFPNPHQDALKSYMCQLTEAIHTRGIGDDELVVGTHALFSRAVAELNVEKESKVLPLIWAATGFNLFFGRGWRAWLDPRLEQARRLSLNGLRSVARAVSPPKVPPQPGSSE
jgi:hypothetical protein